MIFQQHINPLDSLGIGRKALIEKWLDEMGIKNYTINDLTIDVNGYVHLYNKNLIKFPEYIQFNEVNGSFNNLISLRGCPKIVNYNFYCYSNLLESLEGCPENVGNNFSCHHNKKHFTEEYIRKYCNIRQNIYC